MKKNIILLICFGILFIQYSCIDTGNDKPADKKDIEPQLTEKQLDSLRILDTLRKYDSMYPKITYSRFHISDYKKLKELRRMIRETDSNKYVLRVFNTLNRKSTGYLRIGETVVLADSAVADKKAYSIFPYYYPAGRDISKIVFVSNEYQAFGAYEYGRLVQFGATNTGKERTPTYPGRYALVWKEKEHRSSLDSNWKMPFTWNIHAEAGSAFHQFTMPGRPVSHSCCRLFRNDAKWLYYWGKGFKRDSNRKRIPLSGTPVIILGMFDFSRKKGGPWLDLKSNKDHFVELPEKPMEVEEALIPWCQIPDGAKWNIRDKNRFRYAEDTLRARGIIKPHVKLIKSVNFNEQRRKKELAEARAKAEKEKKKKEEEEKKRLEKLNKYLTEPVDIENTDKESGATGNEEKLQKENTGSNNPGKPGRRNR